MKLKDNKQRMFEVMARLDKTFKPKLNESYGSQNSEEMKVSLSTGDDFLSMQMVQAFPDIETRIPETEETIDFTLHIVYHTEYEADYSGGNEIPYPEISDIKLVEGTYKPEYKMYIEKWIELHEDRIYELFEEQLKSGSDDNFSEPGEPYNPNPQGLGYFPGDPI